MESQDADAAKQRDKKPDQAPSNPTGSPPPTPPSAAAGSIDIACRIQVTCNCAARDKPGFWSLYWDRVTIDDEVMVSSWRDDMDGLLIYAGLFATALTAFIGMSFQQLQPDPQAQMIGLLAQLVNITNKPGATADVPASAASESSSSSPPVSAIVVNIFWFVSLVLSLMCGLGATMLKQWARDYQNSVRSPKRFWHRAKMRARLVGGVKEIEVLSEWLVTLLHLAVALFFVGLDVFLFRSDQSNKQVAIAVAVVTSLGGLLYCYFTFASFRSLTSPYRTPLQLLSSFLSPLEIA